jgi:hypothetical protein
VSTSWNTFISVNQSWCTIADVKITFPDELEDSTKEIRELLKTSQDSNTNSTHYSLEKNGWYEPKQHTTLSS